jgi:hypothetical protein
MKARTCYSEYVKQSNTGLINAVPHGDNHDTQRLHSYSFGTLAGEEVL